MPAHNPPMYLELSFDLGAVDTQAAEGACWACGASALTFVDARDDAVNHPTKSGPTCEANSSPLDKTPYFVGTPVLEPAPGEFRLWPRTRLRRSEEHTSELQSRRDLVCRLLLEKKK